MTGIYSSGWDRRKFLKTGASAGLIPTLVGKTWAFGSETFEVTVGDVSVTVVSDGHLVLPANMLAPYEPQHEFEDVIREYAGRVPETIEPETNHALLRTKEDLILVDTGSGGTFQPTAGMLRQNLFANGIHPDTVTKVVFTHAHPDHIWGTTTEDGSLAFPNAQYFIGETEVRFWLDPSSEGFFPQELRMIPRGARKAIETIRDRLVFVKEGDTIAPGISIMDTPGHSLGHISVSVEGRPGLIIAGDVLTHEYLSVQRPQWGFGFDADVDGAAATRVALLDRLATDGDRLLGYHFTYPGIGYITRNGQQYSYTPV